MGASFSYWGSTSPKLLAPSAPGVVVVGGGYGGASAAKKLDESGQFNVLLIDRKNYFFHNVAAMRTASEQDFASDVMVPYAKLMKNGSFVQAEVEEIRPDGIKVRGYASPIKFDYLVVAVGSGYNFPGKSAQTDRASSLLQYRSVCDSIRAAASATLVGGGPAGAELAAEIATQFPDKKVRLIHSHAALLPDNFQPDLKEYLLKELQRLKVEVVLNERVKLTADQQLQLNDEQILRSKSFPSPFSLHSASGKEFDQQLAILCSGAKVANAPLLRNFANVLDDEGRLKVNEFLQVQGFRNIFALGDISAKEPKQAFFAFQQANAVVSNLQQLSTSQPLRAYHPMNKLGAFLSLGKENGVGKLGDRWFPGWMVTWMKSKDLFVGRTWSMLNATQLKQQVKENDMKWIQQQRKEKTEIKLEVLNNDLSGGDQAVQVRVKNLQRFFDVDSQKAVQILEKGIRTK